MVRFARIILTSLVTLNSILLSADTLMIPKIGYQVWYDTHLGVPVKTNYVLARANLRRNVSRKCFDFYPDKVLPAPQVKPACYSHTGYDRGHNVPAADKADNALCLGETFAMSNCSPQTPEFNRHRWKKVEVLVRSLARRYGSIRVVTIPMFIYPDTLWLPCHHVAVPDGFRKKVYCWPTNNLILDTILWQRKKTQGASATIIH